MVGNNAVNWVDLLGLDTHHIRPIVSSTGVKITSKYISSSSAIKYYKDHCKKRGVEANKGKIKQVQGRDGYEAIPEGSCRCSDGSTGEIVLVQYLLKEGWFGGKYWKLDSYTKERKVKSKKTGKMVNKKAGYLDPNTKGEYGTEGGSPGSYVDSPTYDQVIKIEAYCRCDCEDDRLLKTKYIKYDSHADQSNVGFDVEEVKGYENVK